MTTFYSDPHPRILFEDVPDEVYERMEGLAATPRRITQSDSVHETEYDLLVTFAQDASTRAETLHVLSFGADRLDTHISTVSGYASPLLRIHSTSAREISIPSTAEPAALRKLLKETVVPHMLPDAPKTTWTFTSGGFSNYTYRTGDLDTSCLPLIAIGPEGFVGALMRERGRGDGAGVCIALPGETTQHERWLSFMLEILSQQFPERFPAGPDWQTDDPWATPAVAAAVAELAAIESERRVAEAEFARRETIATSSLATAQNVAREGPLRLITEKGPALEEAVASALSAFDFRVQEMDETHVADNGARLEDMRIRTPEDEEWLCLAEVKGYESGVRENDISQVVGKPATHLAMTEKREPSAVWFIFNHWRTRPPDQRHPPFGNVSLALSPLEPFDGAAIDTRDLFRAWRDVEMGMASRADVRQSLLSARGVWAWTPP